MQIKLPTRYRLIQLILLKRLSEQGKARTRRTSISAESPLALIQPSPTSLPRGGLFRSTLTGRAVKLMSLLERLQPTLHPLLRQYRCLASRGYHMQDMQTLARRRFITTVLQPKPRMWRLVFRPMQRLIMWCVDRTIQRLHRIQRVMR